MSALAVKFCIVRALAQDSRDLELLRELSARLIGWHAS